jgi:Xaa-Pro dipeptidase
MPPENRDSNPHLPPPLPPEYRLVPAPEIEARLERARRELVRDGLDGALVVQLLDRYYFTGTLQDGILWLPADGNPVFWVRRSLARARQESPLADIRPLPDFGRKLKNEFRATLPAGGRIGFELDTLPAALATRLESLLPADSRVTDGSFLIRRLRARKSTFEIDCISRAAAIMDEVLAEAASFIKEGVSEFELLGQLDLCARRRGHLGITRMRGWNSEVYLGHILTGPEATRRGYLDAPTNGLGLSPAFSQGAGRTRIRAGVPVSIDFMVNYEGYMADITRVFCLGSPPDDYCHTHERLLGLNHELAAGLRPGKTGAEIYTRALELAGDLGLADYFMGYGSDRISFVGHGIGLEVDEFPFIARGSRMELEPGMIVALEPKLILPPGHRAPPPHNTLAPAVIPTENTYLVREDSPRLLTRFPENITRATN